MKSAKMRSTGICGLVEFTSTVWSLTSYCSLEYNHEMMRVFSTATVLERFLVFCIHVPFSFSSGMFFI
jgi:hypothetical protein